MPIKTKEETIITVTKHGKLTVKSTYIQQLDIKTMQPYNEKRINTVLSAGDWLTEEMAEQYRKWLESGFTNEKPDFI